jgi:hypothetical protein
MARIILFRWLLVIALFFSVIVITFTVSTSHVLADCGTPPQSSCISCHTPGGHGEVMGEWNSIHLRQDLCINCHGGNGSAVDKALAHEGLETQPLNDIYTNCHSCHPTDFLARSDQLATKLDVTPDSCATPTAFAIYDETSKSHTGGIVMAPKNTEGIHTWKSFALTIAALMSLMFFLLGLGWLSGHRVNG